MTVLQLVAESPRPPPKRDRTAVALAALIILTNGGIRIARILAYALILLLAAIGAVSLIGR